MSTKTSKEYKAIKNYIHNELGLTKEDIINAIRSDIRQYVEECICNTYGDDNNLERWIKVMVDNELKNKDFNVIPRMVEKVLKDKIYLEAVDEPYSEYLWYRRHGNKLYMYGEISDYEADKYATVYEKQ